MFANGGIVGLAEWIIDDTCFVRLIFETLLSLNPIEIRMIEKKKNYLLTHQAQLS